MSDNPCVQASANGQFQGPSTVQELQELTTKLCEQNTNAIIQQLQAMNIQTCQYTKAGGAIGGCTLLPPACVAGGAAVQTAVGCEQVALQAQMNIMMNAAISCNLSTAETLTQADIVQGNEIKLHFKGSAPKGVDITIVQQNTSKGTTYNFNSNKVQAIVNDAVKTTLDQLSKALQDTKNGLFSDPVAQKSIQDQVNNIINMNQSDVVEQTVSKAITNVQQTNGVDIIFDFDFCREYNINIEQTNINEYIIQNIVTNFLESTFDSNIENDVKQVEEQQQKQANKGIGLLAGLGGLILLLILLSVVMGMVQRGGGAGAQCRIGVLLKMAIFFSFCLLVFGTTVLVIAIRKNKKQWKKWGIGFTSAGGALLLLLIGLAIWIKRRCRP